MVGLISEQTAAPAPGVRRWGSGFWVFWVCVAGGVLAGVAAPFYLVAISDISATSFDMFLVVGALLGGVYGAIVGLGVGLVVATAGEISRRVSGTPTAGLVAGVVGSCATLWLLVRLPEALPFLAVVAAVGAATLVLLARSIDRRNGTSRERHVRSKDDVDTGEAA